MSTKVNFFFNFFLRFLILGLSVWFLYVQFNNKVSSDDILLLIAVAPQQKEFILFALITFILLPVNWGLEIIKWRILTREYANISIAQCIKGVVSGITISMFLPNRIGDVAGKVLWMKQGTRWKGFFQIAATFLIATPAVWYFSSMFNDNDTFVFSGNIIALLVTAFALLATLVFYSLNLLQKFLTVFKHKRIVDVLHNATVLSGLSFSKKTVILTLSMLRFFIYSLQFFLILKAFGLHIPFLEGILCIALIYLFITIIPQFAIAEIAGRGAVSVFVFTLYFEYFQYDTFASQGAIILLSATFLWIINLFVPAMIGLAMLPDLKNLKKVKQ